MKHIQVSALAERDLDEIWYYVAMTSGSAGIADRLIDSITNTFPLFARSPEAGTRRDEIMAGLRGFPVGNFIIYYAETGRKVVIARVLHGMRDQKTAWGEG